MSSATAPTRLHLCPPTVFCGRAAGGSAERYSFARFSSICPEPVSSFFRMPGAHLCRPRLPGMVCARASASNAEYFDSQLESQGSDKSLARCSALRRASLRRPPAHNAFWIAHQPNELRMHYRAARGIHSIIDTQRDTESSTWRCASRRCMAGPCPRSAAACGRPGAEIGK